MIGKGQTEEEEKANDNAEIEKVETYPISPPAASIAHLNHHPSTLVSTNTVVVF